MPKLQQDTLFPMVPLSRISNLSANGFNYQATPGLSFRLDGAVTEISRTPTHVRLLIKAPIDWRRT